MNIYTATQKQAAVDLLIEKNYRFSFLSRTASGDLIGYWWNSNGEKPYPRMSEFYSDALAVIERETTITPEQIRRRAYENTYMG